MSVTVDLRDVIEAAIYSSEVAEEAQLSHNQCYRLTDLVLRVIGNQAQ